MDGHVQVITTTPTRAEARALALAALDARQAACVQIVGPVESHFRWQGRLEQAEEWLCLIKTSAPRVEALTATIRAASTYDTPEITVTRLDGGGADYLAWIDAETVAR